MLKDNVALTVHTAEKTLELLEMLTAGSEQFSIREMAGELCISRKETLLLLVTLENRGFVYWDDAAKLYRPGQKCTSLTRNFLSQPMLTAAAVPSKTKAPARPAVARPAAVRKMSSGRRRGLCNHVSAP